MKIYLDDERQTPEGWIRVWWPNEAIEFLKTGHVTEISLDHDLGDDSRGTGYDVVLWIEEQVFNPTIQGFKLPVIKVHSANSSARIKMEAGIAAIHRRLAEQVQLADEVIQEVITEEKLFDDCLDFLREVMDSGALKRSDHLAQYILDDMRSEMHNLIERIKQVRGR